MQLFYDPSLNPDSESIVFGPEESKHLIRVLRKKAEDEVLITNGKGHIFTAIIEKASPESCIAKISDCEKKHRPMHWLHLAVAPTKRTDRFEWFLEKATEIGVDEITPVICKRSQRKTFKTERAEKILQAAIKQSGRAYLPKLNPPVTYEDFLSQEQKGLLFIAHCEDDEKLDLRRRVAPDKDITVLIGPEGDFTSKEIKKAYESGYYPVSLGEYRLRTETAALYACATVNLVNSR